MSGTGLAVVWSIVAMCVGLAVVVASLDEKVARLERELRDARMALRELRLQQFAPPRRVVPQLRRVK